VHFDVEAIEYAVDPELIHEKYADVVDLVVDGGYGGVEFSTVVDCTGDEPEIIRQGAGALAH
jgi:tRNA A37 threonylcarbamoyladenosine synthetase subunit TsaC/SUA5/YrdC